MPKFTNLDAQWYKLIIGLWLVISFSPLADLSRALCPIPLESEVILGSSPAFGFPLMDGFGFHPSL
jgi:hypothetical protein